MNQSQRSDKLIEHYARFWGAPRSRIRSEATAARELPSDFHVAIFDRSRDTTAYATICMSFDDDSVPLELHLLTRRSLTDNRALVELLSSIAHFHRTERRLGLGHTVNFGTPWLPGSLCTFGLISLPYLDGPELERPKSMNVQCLWLLPITAAERTLKMNEGIEALELSFEQMGLDYCNPHRASAV